MNILFFLTPKNKVEYIENDFTIRQALEKMGYYHYSAIPIITKDGEYFGTISEGDILWHIRNNHFDQEKAENTPIVDIKFSRDIKEISIDKEMDDLVSLIYNQNFVPVVDDRKKFIGIITRKSIIEYLRGKKQ